MSARCSTRCSGGSAAAAPTFRPHRTRSTTSWHWPTVWPRTTLCGHACRQSSMVTPRTTCAALFDSGLIGPWADIHGRPGLTVAGAQQHSLQKPAERRRGSCQPHGSRAGSDLGTTIPAETIALLTLGQRVFDSQNLWRRRPAAIDPTRWEALRSRLGSALDACRGFN